MKKIVLLLLSVVLCITPACTGEKYETWSSGRTPAGTVEERSEQEYTLQEGTAESFKVANYFSNDMIVPRDRDIVIWGTAPESENGKIVSAEFKGLKGSSVIENEAWRIVLQGTLPASSELGHTLTVRGAEGHDKSFKNVIVGDIWVVSGQSNADLTFFGTIGTSAKDIQEMYGEYMDSASDDDSIRILRQTNTSVASAAYKDQMNEPQTDIAKVFRWSKAGKRRVMGTSALTSFSMLGYFFAKELTKANPDVPIGMIMAACGGAPLSLLASEEANDAFPAGLKDNTLNIGAFTIPACGIYNMFISPLTNVGIKGMIFYQGETDTTMADKYPDALSVLIQDYREKFGTNLSFINVQLTTYGYESAGTTLAGIWDAINMQRFAQAELKVDGSVPGYEIIPTLEIGWQAGNADGAHPYNKLDIAKRAASVTLANVYGIGDPENAGFPVPSEIKYNRSSVEVSYVYAGGGLKTVDGGALKGFEIKKDGIWQLADAVTEGNKVIINEADVKGVRYASELRYFDTQDINLCSGTGNPAVAFSAEWE